MTDTVSVPPFCWGWGQPSVPNFEKGVIRKKNESLECLNMPLPQIFAWGGLVMFFV